VFRGKRVPSDLLVLRLLQLDGDSVLHLFEQLEGLLQETVSPLVNIASNQCFDHAEAVNEESCVRRCLASYKEYCSLSLY